jgi:hypothetical protein
VRHEGCLDLNDVESVPLHHLIERGLQGFSVVHHALVAPRRKQRAQLERALARAHRARQIVGHADDLVTPAAYRAEVIAALFVGREK